MDTNFGTGGAVFTAFAGGDAAPAAIALQADGKIVVAGSLYDGNDDDVAVARYNSDGSLDMSFDGDGKATFDIDAVYGGGGNENDRPTAIALQSDGKILVTGEARNSSNGTDDFFILRLSTNGAPDATFGSSGVAMTDFSSSSDRAVGITALAGGNIILGGRSDTRFAIAKYLDDGSPDTSFDTDGLLTAALSTQDDVLAMHYQVADNKVVLSGSFYDGSAWGPAVARFLSTGALDTTFDTDGKVGGPLSVPGTGGGMALASALQPDGKLVVAGMAYSSASNFDSAVARYLSDGTLDATFGTGGKVLIPFSATQDDRAQAVVIQSDGKIVIGGVTSNDYALARLNTDGTLDTSFDGDGKVTLDFGSGGDEVFALAIQGDGKIVAAGYSWDGGSADAFSLARFNSNGSLDTTFDTDGKIRLTRGTCYSRIHALAIQDDGKNVAAGYSCPGAGNRDFAVLRFNPSNGALDTTFDSDGEAYVAVGASNDTARAMVLQADGKILVAGDAVVGTKSDVALVRLTATGSLDTTFDGDGKVITAASADNDIAQALRLQADGRIVLAGYGWNGLNEDILLIRYGADGALDSAFGSGGKKLLDAISGRERANSLQITADGKYLIAGFAVDATRRDLIVARVVP